ncbi:MAG: site-specific integrase [Planctomycetota bacterium]
MHEPARVSVPARVTIKNLNWNERLNSPSGAMIIKSETRAGDFWPWVRKLILDQPAYFAKMVGIPELASLRHLPIPESAISIDDVVDAYSRSNPSTSEVKTRAVRTFRKLASHADATTLADLTQERLLAWREHIERHPNIKSAGTRTGIYGQVKSILSFGMKEGLDQSQLRAALDRCKVLWTPEPLPPVRPMPISRQDFHTLLAGADPTWRAWLLLALNLAMTAEDLCQLKCEDFDLDAGTFVSIRVKTRRDRIPRAGVIWDETRQAMADLGSRSEYVFTSRHGTKFSKNSRVNMFAKLRKRVGLPDSVKMSHIRDAAYTTACQATSDERWARVLAGHRAPGLQDNYVLRNPEAVRPACEAVYGAFAPFPDSHPKT